MPLQSSGPITISDIQTELGKTPGDPITVSGTDTPGGTPVAGSLFGDATGAINKVAPHSISEFYNYANSVSFALTTNSSTDPAVICGDVTLGSLRYITNGTTYPIVGSFIYTDADLVIPFNGGNNWYRVVEEDSVVKVANDGEVTDKEQCGQTFSFSITQSTFDEDGGTTNIVITSNTAWTISENATWASLDQNSGSGNDTILLTINSYTGSGTRDVSVTGVYGLGSQQSTVSQLDYQYVSMTNVGYDATTSGSACGATPTTLKSDTTDISTATVLLNFFTEAFVPAGYYSQNGTFWKYWDGNSFTGSSGFCS